MGWSTYDVTDGTLNNSNRANAGSADFSRTQLRGGGLDDTIKLEDEQKKRRVSEVTLMLWGIFDLVALGMMVWAVIASGLLSVDTIASKLEVGLFEQCTTPAGGETSCIRTDILSQNPYWMAAGSMFIVTLLLSVIGIIVILLASCNGGGWVRSARLVAASRNLILFVAWVMVPVGFADLDQACEAGNKIHCEYGVTAAQLEGSSLGTFGFFELPSNWKSSIGTYGLFASILMHYVGSGVAGWILLRKGEGLGRQPLTSLNNSFVPPNSSYVSRMTPQGLHTSLDGPHAGQYRSMVSNAQFASGGLGRDSRHGTDIGGGFPTTTLSRTQIC